MSTEIKTLEEALAIIDELRQRWWTAVQQLEQLQGRVAELKQQRNTEYRLRVYSEERARHIARKLREKEVQ